MNEAENRQKLYERMCANMQKTEHVITSMRSVIRTDADYTPACRPAMDVNTTETCPTCFGKGTIKSSILFTDTLESNRLPGQQIEDKEILVTHPPVHRSLRQSGTRLLETEVADEVRIRYQDYSKPEISIPGICILRPARGRDRHEGRNRNQIKRRRRVFIFAVFFSSCFGGALPKHAFRYKAKR